MQVEVVNRSGHPFQTAKPGDVGYDLYACVKWEDQRWYEKLFSQLVRVPVLILWPLWGVRNVSTEIYVGMTDEIWCEVRARSSTLRKQMHILGGTIDSQYQGELLFNLHNFGWRPRLVRDAERYAQVVFHAAVRPIPQEVQRFSTHTLRGASGFGSTGR